MLDTTQRAVVYACMACYVLFLVAIATPERHTKRLTEWVAATITRRYGHDDDTETPNLPDGATPTTEEKRRDRTPVPRHRARPGNPRRRHSPTTGSTRNHGA